MTRPTATRVIALAFVLLVAHLGGNSLLSPVFAQSPADGSLLDDIPTLVLSVEQETGTLNFESTGLPGTAATLRVAIATDGSTYQILQIPFSFDGSGRFQLAISASIFAEAEAAAVHADVTTTLAGGLQVFSMPWSMEMLTLPESKLPANYIPTGVLWNLPLPGTTAPLYPVTFMAVPLGGIGSGLEYQCFLAGPMAYMVATSGIEGLLPVN
jgi:hypothetical protein